MKQELNKLLLEKCEQKLVENDSDKAQYESIKKILSHEDCFDKIPFEVAMNILSDLGFSDDDALELYKKLIA